MGLGASGLRRSGGSDPPSSGFRGSDPPDPRLPELRSGELRASGRQTGPRSAGHPGHRPPALLSRATTAPRLRRDTARHPGRRPAPAPGPAVLSHLGRGRRTRRMGRDDLVRGAAGRAGDLVRCCDAAVRPAEPRGRPHPTESHPARRGWSSPTRRGAPHRATCGTGPVDQYVSAARPGVGDARVLIDRRRAPSSHALPGSHPVPLRRPPGQHLGNRRRRHTVPTPHPFAGGPPFAGGCGRRRRGVDGAATRDDARRPSRGVPRPAAGRHGFVGARGGRVWRGEGGAGPRAAREPGACGRPVCRSPVSARPVKRTGRGACETRRVHEPGVRGARWAPGPSGRTDPGKREGPGGGEVRARTRAGDRREPG